MITNGYVTLEEFKNSLSEAGMTSNAPDDEVMENIITDVSRYIDAYTGHRFYSTTADETRTYSTKNPRRVFTDDIISVTTLKIDDDGDRTYATTVSSTDYDLAPDNAALNGEPYTYIELAPECVESFPKYRRGVQIVGKFGYSMTTPADIRQACLLICVSLYQARRGMGAEGTAQVTGAGVVITPRHVPPMAQRILEHKRKNWGG